MKTHGISLRTGRARKATGVTTLAASGRHILPPQAVTRAELVGSAAALRNMRAGVPAVVVVPDKGTAALAKRVEALEAELLRVKQAAAVAGERFLREERVEAVTRKAPEVVVTSQWARPLMELQPHKLVPVKLPLLQRAKLWLLGR